MLEPLTCAPTASSMLVENLMVSLFAMFLYTYIIPRLFETAFFPESIPTRHLFHKIPFNPIEECEKDRYGISSPKDLNNKNNQPTKSVKDFNYGLENQYCLPSFVAFSSSDFYLPFILGVIISVPTSNI